MAAATSRRPRQRPGAPSVRSRLRLWARDARTRGSAASTGAAASSCARAGPGEARCSSEATGCATRTRARRPARRHATRPSRPDRSAPPQARRAPSRAPRASATRPRTRPRTRATPGSAARSRGVPCPVHASGARVPSPASDATTSCAAAVRRARAGSGRRRSAPAGAELRAITLTTESRKNGESETTASVERRSRGTARRSPRGGMRQRSQRAISRRRRGRKRRLRFRTDLLCRVRRRRLLQHGLPRHRVRHGRRWSGQRGRARCGGRRHVPFCGWHLVPRLQRRIVLRRRSVPHHDVSRGRCWRRRLQGRLPGRERPGCGVPALPIDGRLHRRRGVRGAAFCQLWRLLCRAARVHHRQRLPGRWHAGLRTVRRDQPVPVHGGVRERNALCDEVPGAGVRHGLPVLRHGALPANALRSGLHMPFGSGLQTQRRVSRRARMRCKALHGGLLVRRRPGLQRVGPPGRHSRVRPRALLRRLRVSHGVPMHVGGDQRRSWVHRHPLLRGGPAVRRQRDLRSDAAWHWLRSPDLHQRQRLRLRCLRQRNLPAEPMDLRDDTLVGGRSPHGW